MTTLHVLSAAMSAVSRARFRTPSSMGASGVAAVRAGSHERTNEEPSPASAEPTVVEAGRPPRITTHVTLPRDDPARTLAFIRELFLGRPGDGAGFREGELLILLAIYIAGVAFGLLQILTDERAREIAWRALP